ncbi:MAG: AmmeMemoRadiSam system protein B, partial [Planctomycetes bacterium]|nr:AmmeMemoRadiSam system protein B [Planctomycetota bacterium]
FCLTEGDLVHRDEHSVEFQALWLAHLWPEIRLPSSPLLVRGFHECLVRDRLPAEQPEIEGVITALRETIREDPRNILVLASVDLAHLGPMYDQEEGLDTDGEERMAREDRALLEYVTSGDAPAFFRALARDHGERNVCGTGPIYVALRLGEGAGELLRYGQGRIHPQTGSVVSFAALAFPD